MIHRFFKHVRFFKLLTPYWMPYSFTGGYFQHHVTHQTIYWASLITHNKNRFVRFIFFDDDLHAKTTIQQTITCSNSIIETLEKVVENLQGFIGLLTFQEHIERHVVPVFLLLTLNIFHKIF